MYRVTLPVLVAASLALAACQSTSGDGNAAGTGLRGQETQQQAIERIEREAAQSRAGRGP